MSSSKFVGQLKQNNIQINNLKDQFFRTESHMSDHEKRLSDKVDEFMEKQNSELKSHTQNIENPHHVTKEQVGLSNVLNEEQATKVAFDGHLDDKKNPHAVTKSQVGLSKVDNIQQASKVDFDAHDADQDRHITKDERSYWNSSDERSKSFLAEHTNDQSNPHKVTAEQVGLGNVDNVKQATKSDFDNHLNDTNVHINKSDRDRWDAAQLFKLTADDGKVIYKGNSEKTEYNDLIGTGFYLIANQGLHSPANLSNVYLVVMNYGTTIAQFALEAYYGTHTYFRFRKSDSTWTSWQTHETTDGAQVRATTALNSAKAYTDAHEAKTDIHVTLEDKARWSGTSGSWNPVTLINGATQYSTYPFKFSSVNNVLWLRGSFGTLPAIGTAVAKFSTKPTQLVDFVVPTIGSYGTARFAFTTDGDLRFDGLYANDINSVSRVSFNIGIPLW
ncbi:MULTISPECIES: pyocin knob domain-containing protein [Bacillus amyloliquefaciens group]|uniref:pyocin knob domain-containing protein n=1 Tax=Bacillus amyloliquefaciens group TaxID=1938374 RepID=UPI00214F96C7|nr:MULTISPECIES: pyocin knob domain-containing protein [Bacillus amyloliquefaciens group]MCR4368162.1 pyocin knob domain-containing protein [Bacillus amyloliquefaciens]MCV3200020.1 pyocin knob domain-containing protein [Bacillus velezensis]